VAVGRPDAPRLVRELKEYLVSVLGDSRDCESLFVVDPRGEVIASTRREVLEPWAKEMLGKVDQSEGGSETLVTPLWRSEVLERPTMLVLRVIKVRSRVVGFVVERLDLRQLEALLRAPADPVAFWLLDGTGHVVARESKIPENPGKDAFPGTLPDAGRESVGEARFPEGGLTLFAVGALDTVVGTGADAKAGGPAERVPAFVAATVPAKVAYASLEESRNRLLRIGLPAVAALVVFTFWTTRGQIRPLLRLAEGARRVSAGDLDVYLPTKGWDEIADLTRAFNEMARKVRDGRQSLEEARDELARTNEGLKTANRTLEALAITDGLTGLYNHRHFQDTIEKELRRCEREVRPMSILLLDLDHFKQYNDRWGHTEGDAALRRVAGQVMRCIRSTDMAFRYGGEELAVLLPSCTKEQSAEVAEKVRAAVASQAQRPGRFGGKVTVSIGVATFPEDGRVARGLVDAADSALYAAKAQGRDRVVIAGSTPSPASESSAS
jgi:diguanylate cyclase (GGDEF)-like protein